MLQHQNYLVVHAQILALGLSDAHADEYIDTQSRLVRLVDDLDPCNADFRSTDHTEEFLEAAAKLRRLAELLGYDLSTGK